MSETKTWTLTALDGANNRHTIQNKTPHYQYKGIKMHESSSGEYSGGKDRIFNFRNMSEIEELKELALKVFTDTDNAIKTETSVRPMMWWSLNLDGNNIKVRNGEAFDNFVKKLNEIHETATADA